MIVDICFYEQPNTNMIKLRHAILKDYVDEFIVISSIEETYDTSVIHIGADCVDNIKNVVEIYPNDTIFIISNADEIINPVYLDWFKNTILSSEQLILSTHLRYINEYANTEVVDAYSGKQIPYRGMYFCDKEVIQGTSITEIINGYSQVFLVNNNEVITNTGWAFKNNKLKENEIILDCHKNNLPKQIWDFPPFKLRTDFKQSIPVIGTGVVNSTYWVTRLIASVDFPVDSFVIINNGGVNLCEELEHIKTLNKKFIKEIKIVNLPGNIGCAGWWNLVIKCYMTSTSWVLVNDDVAFTPGLLQELYTKSLIPDIGLIHGANHYIESGHYDLFLVKDFIIEKYGLFDENCFPAYMEDVEYFIRLKANRNPPAVISSLDHQYYHGMSFNYADTGGASSKHIKKDIVNEVGLTNLEYVIKKWGDHPYNSYPADKFPVYRTPFNLPAADLKYSAYDLKFNRTKLIPGLTDKQI